MKKLPYIMILTLGSALFGGCSETDHNEPRELVRIYGLSKQRGYNIGNVRQQALREAAETLGAQAGLQWRAEQIDCLLKEQRVRLDDIYNFRSLMLRDHVAPPVLAEGRQAVNLASFESIRAADVVYRIVRPPRFVTAAPNWREYLWLRYTRPEDPDVSLLPKNREEAAYWNCFVKQGWDHGVDQANQIFVANLNRLNRDYLGMILYHRLYSQRMVSAPFVSKADLGVTGDCNEMRVNDRVLRIAETSCLNTNANEWRTAVYPVKMVRISSDDLAKLPKSFDDLPGPAIVDKHGRVQLPPPEMNDQPINLMPDSKESAPVPKRLMR